MIQQLNLNAINNIVKTVSPKDSVGAVDLSNQFSDFLGKAVDNLNMQQSTVDKLNEQFITGNLQDVHKLMIASEKATLGLDLAIQVRNKAVDAYKEIMRMQI